MPTYSFRCPDGGGFELRRPMVDADRPARYPRCARSARRVFAVPALRGLDPAVRRALDVGERSADAPDVVTFVPGRSRRATRITTDPRHARLPRP